MVCTRGVCHERRRGVDGLGLDPLHLTMKTIGLLRPSLSGSRIKTYFVLPDVQWKAALGMRDNNVHTNDNTRPLALSE